MKSFADFQSGSKNFEKNLIKAGRIASSRFGRSTIKIQKAGDALSRQRGKTALN
jgi:hypothetical protein